MQLWLRYLQRARVSELGKLKTDDELEVGAPVSKSILLRKDAEHRGNQVTTGDTSARLWPGPGKWPNIVCWDIMLQK